MDTNSYNRLFGIERNALKPSDKQLKAFTQASDIRKFEIEMYWKRAAYFWTLIAVTFTGFFALSAAANLPYKNLYSLLISSMGLIFTLSWYLVNRGSKYWQENWENHLDLLENEITGPLYKTVLERPEPSDPFYKDLGKESVIERLLTSPRKTSVSKINQWVALYVLIIWLFLFSLAFIDGLLLKINLESCHPQLYCAFFILTLTIITILALLYKGKTHTGQHNPKARVRTTKISG